MCTVRKSNIEGVRVLVHHCHRLLGHTGRPFVVQVADALIMTSGGSSTRWAKRFTTPEQGLKYATFAVSALLQRRRALREAWLP